ncbi:MAG: pectinesterase family protein [Prevotella sp.]|nr:pectinesterase family protein [Prevotella sp.]
MFNYQKTLLTTVLILFTIMSIHATIEGSLDPESVVAEWSNSSTYPKVIDINFSDDTWPDTWTGETGVDCPEYDDGAYINAILETPANGGTEITYPVLFHNCTFATKKSYNGYAGATAAFCRQYYEGQSCTGNSVDNYNNWTVPGHTTYLEDNIQYDENGVPNYGEAGFVQMCRNAGVLDVTTHTKVSLHGWMEIDHIPYVERVQWSWSSTSWGRGIKCDVKIGDGDWEPLVWMGSEKQKSGWTMFSDQGYFMENVIDASDVSIRWRVWDGDNGQTLVQVDEDGNSPFGTAVDSTAQMQAPRVHKIQIFGNEITADEAEYARNNPVSDVGELSDLDSENESETEDTAPDANAPIVLATVAQDGTGDYTTIQSAINAVPDGSRGIIYIRPGVYDENIYCGTKSSHDKYISLIGENKETTILTSSVDRGSNNSSNTYNDCAALNVYTSRFYAENITIRNTSGNVGQAEALYTNGDAHIFNNCLLSGYQDTYKSNVSSRGYFTNCTIEGATDFIYDSGLEWFENCEIHCVKGGGYITAAADASVTMISARYPELSNSPFYAGLCFRNCNITAEDGVADGAYYLGRPWKEKCGTMFLQCTLGSHINSAGWLAWNGNEEKCSYLEYKNVDTDGNLVDTSSRASFSYQATDDEVEAYMNPEFLFAKESDVPFDYATILNGAAAPTNFTVSDTEITWESDDMAVGYLIYKDDVFVDFIENASYSKDTDDKSVYKVRSVSKHGVTSDAVAVTGTTQLLAFPTAEGFGKYTTGGRGGQVVTVTSLANSGTGSLRWAFEQYPDEPITIVFAVSGDIHLTEPLKVNRADWTLAGQTAPGDGIIITHDKLNVGGSENFIIRNVRFRIGQLDSDGEVYAESAFGGENCENYILDHCSFGWSVEEVMDTQDSHFLTVQNCIVHEGLYNAGHSKGARGYASQWGGSPATYYRNLLANNHSRSPRFNGARGEDYVVFLEYINNVNFNWGTSTACYGGENTADISNYNGLNSAHECNFMNNYYKPGPESPSNSKFVLSSYARDGATSWGPAKWYINGNVMEGNDAATADNWTAVSVETYTLDDIRVDERIVTQTPYYRYSLIEGKYPTYVPEDYMIYDYETAEDAFNTVVNTVGTVNRDKVEQRIINDLKNGTCTWTGSVSHLKGIIDVEGDAEGFFDYSTDYTVPADTDGDGMPDEWENAHGLDPNNAEDRNTICDDGYTALEVYLNTLMGDYDEPSNGIGTVISMERPEISYDKATNTLHISENALGSVLNVYSTNGQLLLSRQLSSSETSLSGLPTGMLLLRVSGNSICPRVLKVVK